VYYFGHQFERGKEFPNDIGYIYSSIPEAKAEQLDLNIILDQSHLI
jgi:hypothetical protein